LVFESFVHLFILYMGLQFPLCKDLRMQASLDILFCVQQHIYVARLLLHCFLCKGFRKWFVPSF